MPRIRRSCAFPLLAGLLAASVAVPRGSAATEDAWRGTWQPGVDCARAEPRQLTITARNGSIFGQIVGAGPMDYFLGTMDAEGRMVGRGITGDNLKFTVQGQRHDTSIRGRFVGQYESGDRQCAGAFTATLGAPPGANSSDSEAEPGPSELLVPAPPRSELAEASTAAAPTISKPSARSVAGPPDEAPTPSELDADTKARIARLETLLDQGLIDETEYRTKLRQLLAAAGITPLAPPDAVVEPTAILPGGDAGPAPDQRLRQLDALYAKGLIEEKRYRELTRRILAESRLAPGAAGSSPVGSVATATLDPVLDPARAATPTPESAVVSVADPDPAATPAPESASVQIPDPASTPAAPATPEPASEATSAPAPATPAASVATSAPAPALASSVEPDPGPAPILVPEVAAAVPLDSDPASTITAKSAPTLGPVSTANADSAASPEVAFLRLFYSYCMLPIDDLERIRGMSAEYAWKPLPEDYKQTYRPVGSRGFDGWVIVDDAADRVLVIHESTRGGRNANVCALNIGSGPKAEGLAAAIDLYFAPTPGQDRREGSLRQRYYDITLPELGKVTVALTHGEDPSLPAVSLSVMYPGQ